MESCSFINSELSKKDYVNMKKCCVIMSSYYGEKYIAHQFNSILNQVGVDVDIFVRDDGSRDCTVQIINDFCQKFSNIFFIEGRNVGVIESFRLAAEYVLKHAKRYDYYAFADQDDEWLPNKLQVAVEKLENESNEKLPMLYYSNLKVVNEELNYMYERFPKGYVSNTKKQLLSEICVLGCTCVFNYELLQEYVRTNINHKIPHDAWIAVLAGFLGRIIYDEKSYILYRQHGTNQSGSVKRGLSMYIEKIKRFKHIFDVDGDYEIMAREILTYYSQQLIDSDVEMFRTISDYRRVMKYRLRLLFTNYISSGHLWKEVARRVRIICNRL